MENTPPKPTDNLDAIEVAANELFKGGGLELSSLARPTSHADSDPSDSHQMTNDDIYDFMQENRDRTFDYTTAEGRNFFNRFEEANKRRNNFGFAQIKSMVGRIATVPAEIVTGVFKNPLKVPVSIADGMARDASDMWGIMLESEDPSSPLFRFKSYITGTGTTEERIKQFNEARWWNNRSNQLEEGKDTMIEHWVPDNYREFARGLIDPKLANALSYIGLETPHLIKSAFTKGGIRESAEVLKGSMSARHTITATEAAATHDWFSTTADKFKRLSAKITGETLSVGGEVAQAPFEFLKEKILRGSTEIESRIGYVPAELSNGASTIMADAGSAITSQGMELSPMKNVLFSFGVKPIAEYASVLGKELVDASQGVVRIKNSDIATGLMDRLALNGGRIGLSKEAQAVAKFANVVVGWPASMAFPVLKRAAGDAAYMGALGYLNARGEGAASGVGVGFAWGGLSGSFRHLHNVYNQSIAHSYVIDNFDKAQLLDIEKVSPAHARNVREFLSNVDSHGDRRVSATVRAEIMMGWAAAPDTELRYATVDELRSEYGDSEIITQLGSDFQMAGTNRGGHLVIKGKDVIWVNKNGSAPEAIGHEFGHRFLDILLSKTDGSAVDALKTFIGDKKDSGVLPDIALARLIGNYSQFRFGKDSAWLNNPTPDFEILTDASGNSTGKGAYGNVAFAMEEIKKMREEASADPQGMFDMSYKDGKNRLKAFENYPIIEKLMHEVFAYSHSNNMLIRSPDFFLRNPETKTMRYVMENWHMLNNQRVVSNMEAAGYILRESENNGETVLQSMFWDDGKNVRFPMLDKWGEDVMRRVLRNSDIHVSTMSPERAEAFLKQTHKQRLLNGGKMKTKKEVEETITATADAIAATLDALPDSVKPKWTMERNGSKKIKLTELTKESWDAIEASNVYHPEEFKVLVGMVDVLKQVEAGKPVFNTFTGQYLGWSKQITLAALGERLKGNQVPVTFRHFAPFDIELTVSKFDEFGKPLKAPRSHITIHAHDINVLNRRKMNQWQKGDVRGLFKDFGHFSETFVGWFTQLSLDPSQRQASADYLRPEFGSNAERVRDIMYETWGGRKRNDENFINIPEGYAGGRDGPDYPIHSLRFDLLANVLRQSQVFPEAFQGALMGLVHRHGIAYEPMRRNMMLGGFVQRPLANGRSFYTDGNGFEVRGEEPSLKLFNMYGNLVGVFKSMAKVQSAVEKQMAKAPREELMPNMADMDASRSTNSDIQQYSTPVSVHTGSANLMTGEKGYADYSIDDGSRNFRKFKAEAEKHLHMFRHGMATSAPNTAPRIKVLDLVRDPSSVKLIYPNAENLHIEVSPYADMFGGICTGIQFGAQQGVIGYIHPDMLASAGGVKTASFAISEVIQQLIDIKEGRATARRVPFMLNDIRFTSSNAAKFRAQLLLDEHSRLNRDPQNPLTFKQYLADKSDEYVRKAVDNWMSPAGSKLPQRKPVWFDNSKTLKDGRPWLAMSVLEGSRNAGFTDKSLSELNDWFCTIADSLMKGDAHVFNHFGQTTIVCPPDFFNLPKGLTSEMDADYALGQNSKGLWSAFNKMVAKATLTHAIAKMGDRDTLGNAHRSNNEMFKSNNLEASQLNDRPYSIGDGMYSAVNVDVAKQASELWDGFGPNGAIIVSFEAGQAEPSLSNARAPRANLVTNTLHLMGATTKGKATGGLLQMKPTTSPASGNQGILKGNMGIDDVHFDMHTELITSGNAPFLGGLTGKLHTAYKNGFHLGALKDMSEVAGITFDIKKDGTAAGLDKYVKALGDLGVDSANRALIYRFAIGCKMAEIGREVLSGDPSGHFQKWSADSFNELTAGEWGETLVNMGYANMTHALASSSAGFERLSLTKRQKREGWFGPNSLLERAFSPSKKETARFSKSMLRAADEAIKTLQDNGHDPANMSKSATNMMRGRSDLMLGGMSAREIDMIASGAMRFVKTDSGKMYKAFEFSDKDASLLTEKVGGKLHLLPFSKGGEKDFDGYYKDFMRSQAPMMSTDSLKLGELIDHKLLFAHYPSLKDVRVEWDYGYGAHYNPEADTITLGIDRYIGREMHERGSPDHLDYASFGINFERKALDTILHEVQHAIQRREQWTDSSSTKDSGLFQKAGLILANNITGVAGRTLSTERVVNDSGRIFYTNDPSSAPSQFDNAQVIQSVIKMAGSPMHMNLRQYAYPNLIKVSEEVMLGLADAHMHHPAGHMSRVNAENLSKKIGAIRSKAIEAMEAFKRGDLRETEAKDIVCEHVMNLENLIESGVGMLSIENSPVADRLYNSMNNSLKYMRRSMQALNAFQIISKMADSGAAGLDVGSFSAKAKEIFSTVSTMQYLAQKHEIEADLTESRSQMTQEQLNTTGINPDMTRVNALDAISGAMDIGYAGNSIRAIGLALKNKTPIRVANLMIGGTGDAKLKPEERSNEPLKLMARGALVSWMVKTLDNELQQLNAVAFYGRGWEIDKQGVPRLTFRQGIIRVKGNRSVALEKQRNIDHGEFKHAALQGHGEGSLGIYAAISADGQSTVTLQDIARIIDGIVVSESELITPTEAMDIITRDDFPSVIKVKDLPEILKSRGISDDGLLLSNATLFSQVDLADFPTTMTKGELIDTMAIVHRQLVHERTATRSFGSGVLRKAKFNTSEVNPLKLLKEVDEKFVTSSYYDPTDQVRQFVDTLLGRDALPEMFKDKVKYIGTNNEGYGHNRFGILNISYETGMAVLNPTRPNWVEPMVWNQLVEKWTKKGYMDAGYFGAKHEVQDTDAARMMRESVVRQANLLNRRLTRKLFMLKPFYEQVIAKLATDFDSEDPTRTNQLMAVKFALLDEVSLAMIEPDLAGFRSSTDLETSALSHRQFGTKAYESHSDPRAIEMGRTSNQLGIAPAIYASGYSPEVRDAFIELQTLMPMVGFTSESSVRSSGLTNSEVIIGERGIQLYSLIDDLGEAKFAADTNIQDNLMSVTTSALATKALTEKVMNELVDAGEDVNLESLKFLTKLSAQAATLAQTATVLIGDVQSTGRDYTHRNVQRDRAGGGSSPHSSFIQELALLRGYRGADGGLVLQENLMADTSSALTHKRNMELPIWNHSLSPAGVASRDFNAPAVKASVMKDLAARAIIFGAINDGAGNVTRPMSYIGPLADLAETIHTTQQGGRYSERGVMIDTSTSFTNGLHALHSAMYLASNEKGIAITEPLTQDATFYKAWAQPDMTNSLHHQGHAGGHTIESFAIGLAPFLATAMSEKAPLIKDGKLVVGDILGVEQRALLNAARDAYRGHDFNQKFTPEMDAARRAFFETLSTQQISAIISHVKSSNASYGLVTMLGVMNAYKQIKKLPEAPHVSAKLGNDVRSELNRQLDFYLTEGKYVTEMGVNDVESVRLMYEKGNTASWINSMTSAVFSDPITQNALLAAWSVMDGSRRAYVPDMTDGNPSRERPHTALMTYMSGNAYAYQMPTHKAATTSVGSMFTGSNDHPRRTHSIVPQDTNRIQTRELNTPAIGFSGEEMGLASALFKIYDPASVDADSYTTEAQAEILANQPVDALLGVHKAEVGFRGSPISQTFIRKNVVNSIVAQAKRMGTNKVSIEPARFRLSGRTITRRSARSEEPEAGSSGIKYKSHAQGFSSLFAGMGLVPDNANGATTYDSFAENLPFMTSPMLGFAWKRLEDGRLVINMTGDHAGYKSGYLGRQYSPQVERTKIPVGFSISESLGYDPYTGEISPPNIHLALFGGMSMANYSADPAGMNTAMSIRGESWRKQLIKSARARIAKGDSIRTRYEGVDANKSGITYRNTSQGDGFVDMMSSDNAHNNAEAVSMAYSILGHRTGHQYASITLPANATPEVIRGFLHNILIGSSMSFLMAVLGRISSNSGLNSPFLGDGAAIYNALRNTASGITPHGDSGVMSRIGSLMFDEGFVAGDKQSINMEEIIQNNGRKSQEFSGVLALDSHTAAFKRRAELVLGRSPRLLEDIEALANMATKSDHGYSIPDAERHLTKNGDTTLAIELMFPNRPEMQKFAWDGKEDNGVSIVHRGPKAKPTGYFVTYDYQTGIDQYGNPITTKKVIPTKTLAEAENIRSQFGVKASKAILAQALVAAGMEAPQIKQGVTNRDSNVNFETNTGKVLKANENGLTMVNNKTHFVGDFDKPMTLQEATAVSAILMEGDVLQTNLPPVSARSANLMIGSRDARELEGLLRRKLTFGNGSGPIEFSSKLMRVVAYGKRKQGRDPYPDSMTGAEWYKFFKENTISKDEIRMTGIVYLLHENMNTALTRQDLAEFIYTVYPRTSRQVRRANANRTLAENTSIKAGSLSGLYNLPFIEDVQAKEDFVVNTHLDNLQKVASLIEQKRGVEETKADAMALAEALRKSIQFTVLEMGMPPDAAPITNFDLQGSIEYMRNLYKSTTETSATAEGFYGEGRGVRPAQLDYIMRDAVWGRLGDQYRTIEASLGELGFINPYEIEYADQSKNRNPFNATGDGSVSTLINSVSIAQGEGVMGSRSPTKMPYPSLSQQGLYYHGGNYHASYATFSGFYQSSPHFVEVTNARMLEESKRAKATLKDRMDHAKDPEQKKKIQSIIDTIERVEAVRKLVGGYVADFSHYSENDQGTFQLGHVRSTETVLLGEYGIANHLEPAFHREDPVSGYAYEPETVIGIEEIQSDSFQYHTFGPPSSSEKSLPDTFEQIEGLKKAGDLSRLMDAKKRLEASVKDTQTIINQNLKYQMMSNRGDNRMNAMFLMKNLSILSPIELYMLKDSLKLKETGRTMPVPEHYKQYIGKDTIPVYAPIDFEIFRDVDDKAFPADSETPSGRGNAVAVGRKIAVQISHLAHGDVLASLLPPSFMGFRFEEDTFAYREDVSNRPMPTPSFVFLVHAAQDPEVISKSIQISESNKSMLGATDVDWDAVASRTIDRIESMREQVLNGETIDQHYLRDYAGVKASRLARSKFFENLIATYRERLQSPRNQMLMPDVKFDGAPIEARMGDGYEDSPLQSSIRQKPNRYVLISEPVELDRRHPAQLLFPTSGMLERSASNHSLDFRSAEIAPEVGGEPASYSVQLVAANTALGQFAASSVSGLISHVSSMGNVPAQIKDLQVAIDALAPQIPISTSGNEPKLMNSLPYGVEDIYKPVAIMGTVLRAANAGLGAITYSDARMQVMRGHSMEIVPTMLIGRQANMFAMSSESSFAQVMSQISVLPDAIKTQLHGGLFKRFSEADQAFFVKAFRRSEAFEHNGVSGDIRMHMALAARDAFPHLMTEGLTPSDFENMKAFWRAIEAGEGHLQQAAEDMGRPSDSYGVNGESNILDAEGKPYKAKDLPTEFFKKYYGNVVQGEKNDRQRVIDSAVANAGSSNFYWSEQGRAMGYVSQYGAPSWFIQSIMFGQKQAAIDKFSTDAFQRPVVTIANDGSYTLLDPKTGRAIMEKITHPRHLREAFFQNSKYLGSVPYIAKFLSEWTPVGAYVTQGHTIGKVTGEGLRSKLSDTYDLTDYPSKYRVMSIPEFGGVVARQPSNSSDEIKAGQSFTGSQNSKSMQPFGGAAAYVGMKVWMKHVNKVNVASPEDLSKAMSTYFSCGGPVLRFKPRMPTEVHKKAFRKKIVEGIAMLMPSNGGKGRAEANTQTLEMLSNMYRNFSKVTMGRKIPTQGEALEDEDESSRP